MPIVPALFTNIPVTRPTPPHRRPFREPATLAELLGIAPEAGPVSVVELQKVLVARALFASLGLLFLELDEIGHLRLPRPILLVSDQISMLRTACAKAVF